FEIVNCAPKAIGFPAAARARVLQLAESHDLLVVGASDNHGWGQVTCVWNLSSPSAHGYRSNRVIARPIALAQGESQPWTAAYTPLFLRSNARSAGLTDRGQPMQATYVAALEGGRIAGVAAHCWNGMVLVQAPEGGHAAAAALEAVRRSGRTVTGFSGPWDQVVAAREALGLGAAPAAKDSRDELYVLDLARLVVPPELASGALRCRHPAATELELLVDWRVRVARDALGARDGAHP